MMLRCVLGLMLLMISSTIASADAVPAEIWDAIHENTLDLERSVLVADLEVDLVAGFLRLHSGILTPSTPISGRTTELVFVGEADFLLAPEDAIEQGQLELFTDRKALTVDVQRAVLVIGREATVQALLDRPCAESLDEERRKIAEEAYSTWVQGAVRRGFGADAAQLRSLVGDRSFDGYFLAWLATEELGEFYYALDPSEPEQVTLGQFVPLDVDDRDAQRIRKEIRRGQRKGRFARLRIDDLGVFDTWVSMSLQDGDGAPAPGGSGFESEHYTIEATLDPAEESLSARVRVRVRSDSGGSRVLAFDLYSDSTVRSIESRDGRELPWLHGKDGLLVVLPEALAAGATTEIAIRYDSKVLNRYEKGVYVLLDTYSWYPRIGDVDRATYDATLRWPRRQQLLASGKVVESGEEDGLARERRTLDIPTIGFAFEIGAFDIRTIPAGDVTITVAFSKASGGFARGTKQAVLENLAQALVFYEEQFGDYPLDFMTVVTVPRGFSQGYLGFVTLSHYLLTNYGPGQKTVDTIAHELSHQWWGNKVGWGGYRDQWLSEALADYSSMLYASAQAERTSVYLALHAQEWKRTVNRRLLDGRSVESVGPVVLGSRLASSKSSSAYQAIVYQKGSVVFNMLAQSLGREPFTKMLGTLADAVNHRTIDTRTFLSAIERMSGADLDQFSRRFVQGTGIPEVYYNYRFLEQEDGTWIVEGQARQVAPVHFDFVLQRTENDTWRVTRIPAATLEMEQWALAVPFQVALSAAVEEDKKVEGGGRLRSTTQRGVGGRIVIRGEETDFSIPIPEQPERFWFDQRGEVLVTFYSEQREPKRMLRYRAIELASAMRFEEAEELYRQALAAPLYSEAVEDPPSRKEIERDTRTQDALIHIALSRMFLDMEHDVEATAELELADDLLKGYLKDYYATSRMVLRSHLAIRAGDYESAFRKMEKSAYLRFPYRHDETMKEAARRRKFSSRSRSRMNGMGYALFAVAAHEMGRDDIAERAADEAKKRGAVVETLEERLDESG